MNNHSITRGSMQPLGEKSNPIKTLSAPLAYAGVETLRPASLGGARTREQMRELAESAWRQRGLALIDPLLISDEAARAAVIAEATRLYGRLASTVAQVSA